MNTPHSICNPIHTSSATLASRSPSTCIFPYPPLFNFHCSPPLTPQSLHPPLLLTHQTIDSEFQSKTGFSDLLQYPDTPLNGLGIHYADPSPTLQKDVSGLKDSPSTSFGDFGDYLLGPLPIPQSTWPISTYLDLNAAGSPSRMATGAKPKPSIDLQGIQQWSSSYTTPPMFPPFADINMFKLAASTRESPTGVNPADISNTIPELEEWLCGDPDSPLPPSSSSLSARSPENLLPVNEVSSEVLDEIMTILSSSENLPTKDEDSSNSLFPFGPTYDSPTKLEPYSSSPFPSPRRDYSSKRSHPKNDPESVYRDTAELESTYLMPPNLGTPVLDAHRGVLLPNLLSKAERYRLRNPGREIDKRWLSSFAGKLTARGELLEDFRCYVIGCTQTNKRRDHILIHIGSHVDQRPFPCGYCSMRFLRKNERKRHEASHTGNKPYICDICPNGEKAFVRLDLLRRHMKRTHGVDKSGNKENHFSSTGFKRARLFLE